MRNLLSRLLQGLQFVPEKLRAPPASARSRKTLRRRVSRQIRRCDPGGKSAKTRKKSRSGRCSHTGLRSRGQIEKDQSPAMARDLQTPGFDGIAPPGETGRADVRGAGCGRGTKTFAPDVWLPAFRRERYVALERRGWQPWNGEPRRYLPKTGRERIIMERFRGPTTQDRVR